MATDTTTALDTTTAMDTTMATDTTMAAVTITVMAGVTILQPGIRTTQPDLEPTMVEDVLLNTVPPEVTHQATVKQVMVEKQLDGQVS